MRAPGFARCTLTGCVAAALLAACGTSHLPSAISPSDDAPFAFTHHMTFRYTGKKQTFIVPRGVGRIRVIAVGANGGGSIIAHGGRVSAVIPVTPSEMLAIYVGGAGTSSEGGFNGGGAGGTEVSGTGNGGGGASDVREGGDALKDRVVVAGGAGGSGTYNSGHYGRGGKGGARTSGSGRPGYGETTGNGRKADLGGTGGNGGTQSQGGSGGKGPDGAQNAGESGHLGIGGTGGSGCGGSGTCGYDGGDGGGGGGGGSSYAEPNASNVQMERGAKDADGNGLVMFSWQ